MEIFISKYNLTHFKRMTGFRQLDHFQGQRGTLETHYLHGLDIYR